MRQILIGGKRGLIKTCLTIRLFKELESFSMALGKLVFHKNKGL